jgi:hypothetical protein
MELLNIHQGVSTVATLASGFNKDPE